MSPSPRTAAHSSPPATEPRTAPHLPAGTLCLRAAGGAPGRRSGAHGRTDGRMEGRGDARAHPAQNADAVRGCASDTGREIGTGETRSGDNVNPLSGDECKLWTTVMQKHPEPSGRTAPQHEDSLMNATEMPPPPPSRLAAGPPPPAGEATPVRSSAPAAARPAPRLTALPAAAAAPPRSSARSRAGSGAAPPWPAPASARQRAAGRRRIPESRGRGAGPRAAAGAAGGGAAGGEGGRRGGLHGNPGAAERGAAAAGRAVCAELAARSSPWRPGEPKGGRKDRGPSRKPWLSAGGWLRGEPVRPEALITFLHAPW